MFATVARGFDCVDAAENTMRNDDKILEALQGLTEPLSVDCLGSLVRGNHFKSANYVIDTLDSNLVDEAIVAAKEASRKVQD